MSNRQKNRRDRLSTRKPGESIVSNRPAPPREGRPRPAPMRQVVAEKPFIQRYRGWIFSGIALAVIIAVIVIVVIKFGPSGSGKETAAGDQPADPAVVAQLTGVSPATFDAVGLGSASNPPKAIQAPALTQNGKPEVLYVGAEYCPFCAAERWAMIVALSRFGSFSNLHTTHSSASDVYANTPTFTFYGSTYTSQYLTFDSVEQTTNQPNGNGYTPLQSLSAEQQSIFNTYNKPPYVSTAGSIPFVDFGGKYILSGATYDPGALANQSWSQIASQLNTPTSSLAKSIDGSANLLTAAICKLTGNQPGNVCTSAGVTKAAQSLGSGQ